MEFRLTESSDLSTAQNRVKLLRQLTKEHRKFGLLVRKISSEGTFGLPLSCPPTAERALVVARQEDVRIYACSEEWVGPELEYDEKEDRIADTPYTYSDPTDGQLLGDGRGYVPGSSGKAWGAHVAFVLPLSEVKKDLLFE